MNGLIITCDWYTGS